MKRWSRRLAKFFLGFCLFWTLVHLVEDWLGKRVWEAWKRDQVAKGAIYDPSALVGPPIPDADNFAKAPIIQGRLRIPAQPIFPEGFKLESPDKPAPGWRVGRPMDFKPWMEANHTKDLAAFLAPAGPQLLELAEAAKRPASHFDPPGEEGDVFPGLLQFRYAARALNLRALVALRAGRPGAALQDVLTELRLGRHLAKEPALTGQLVQLAVSGIAMQTIWEGLESHTWNEAQLADLQEELSNQDELTPFLTLGRDDRISTNRYWSNLAGSPWWDHKQPIGSVLGHALIPRGWLYRNMFAADEHLAETWLVAVDPLNHRMYRDKVQTISSWWGHQRPTPYSFIAKQLSSISADAMVGQAQRFAERQVALDEAFIVCALERYRLAHQAYPESLEALVPIHAAKLPCDILTGAPLHYTSTSKGFLLYSVGWDGNDEGGAMKMNGQDRNLSTGDWPWPHASEAVPRP